MLATATKLRNCMAATNSVKLNMACYLLGYMETNVTRSFKKKINFKLAFKTILYVTRMHKHHDANVRLPVTWSFGLLKHKHCAAKYTVHFLISDE